jgi:hypothetical protein
MEQGAPRQRSAGSRSQGRLSQNRVGGIDDQRLIGASGLRDLVQAGRVDAGVVDADDERDAGTEFLNAIKQIQGQALGCTFAMPTPDGGETINPNEVNVWYTPSSGGEEIIYKVEDAAGCDSSLGGWYYDHPTAPTEIILCPKSCDAIGGTKGTIRIELGCTTQQIPT